MPRVVITGQHEPLDVGSYGFPPLATATLGCCGLDDPRKHAEAVAAALQPNAGRLGLVVVQGDTSSALGGAMAGHAAGVPVAHVEAGLRSHDSRHPWPEEDFRIVIDRLSTLLFAPTELSASNLRRERIAGAIHVVGNTGVDAALARQVKSHRLSDGSIRRLLVTCHRRESWGDGLTSIAAALREIASTEEIRIQFVLHPNPLVAASMRQLLRDIATIHLLPPCSHEDMLRAMTEADLVLSDSGGMQEEAPLLGVPLLVLRNRTERPEAIATGNIELVGTGRDRIASAVRRLLADPRRLARMSRPTFPYGDGRASERIAAIITNRAERERRSRAA